jgi:hypothetical protein
MPRCASHLRWRRVRSWGRRWRERAFMIANIRTRRHAIRDPIEDGRPQAVPSDILNHQVEHFRIGPRHSIWKVDHIAVRQPRLRNDPCGLAQINIEMSRGEARDFTTSVPADRAVSRTPLVNDDTKPIQDNNGSGQHLDRDLHPGRNRRSPRITQPIPDIQWYKSSPIAPPAPVATAATPALANPANPTTARLDSNRRAGSGRDHPGRGDRPPPGPGQPCRLGKRTGQFPANEQPGAGAVGIPAGGASGGPGVRGAACPPRAVRRLRRSRR